MPPEPDKVAFRADDLLPAFWKTLSSALDQAVEQGQLERLEFNVFRGSPAQIAAFHADLDRRLSSLSKNL